MSLRYAVLVCLANLLVFVNSSNEPFSLCSWPYSQKEKTLEEHWGSSEEPIDTSPMKGEPEEGVEKQSVVPAPLLPTEPSAAEHTIGPEFIDLQGLTLSYPEDRGSQLPLSTAEWPGNRPRRKDPTPKKFKILAACLLLLVILSASIAGLFFLLHRPQTSTVSRTLVPTAGSNQHAPIPTSIPSPATLAPTSSITPTPSVSSTQTPNQTLTPTPPVSKTPVLVPKSPTPSPPAMTTLVPCQSNIEVRSVAWSPDSRFLASGGYDYRGTILVWDVTQPTRPVRTYKPSTGNISLVYALAWSPDGHYLTSGGPDNTWRLWDATAQGTTIPPLATHPAQGTIWSLSWAPDHRRLAIAECDGTMRIIDALTGAVRSISSSHQGSTVAAVAWSPDGQRIATGNWDGTLQLWDADGSSRFTDSSHAGAIGAISWSPHSTFVVTGSNDTTVRVWDAGAQGSARFVSPSQKREVHAVAWSPTSNLIASGDFSGIVQIWSAM